VSDAFDERLSRTRGQAEQLAAAQARAQAERERRSREHRAAAAAAARALLPELRAAIEALRTFEENDPARTSPWRLEQTKLNLGFFPDSAPVTLAREYRPAPRFRKGSELKGWVLTTARGGLSLTIPRAPGEPLVVSPFGTLEEAANAGIYSQNGRVVVTSEAFDAVIQTIADHIARGHGTA
jgi:hypothetical protein